LQLRIVRDKVDHPRKGSKDLADAVCGAIYNAISRTSKGDREVKIHTYSSMHRDEILKEREKYVRQNPGVIDAPKRSMPEELASALDNLRVI
jgi:hypothetical protein